MGRTDHLPNRRDGRWRGPAGRPGPEQADQICRRPRPDGGDWFAICASRRKRRTGERGDDPGRHGYGWAASHGFGRRNSVPRGAHYGAQWCRKRCPRDRRNSRRGYTVLHPRGTLCIALHRAESPRRGSTPQRVRTSNLRFRRATYASLENCPKVFTRAVFPLHSKPSALLVTIPYFTGFLERTKSIL
jgi:hypothetical protein